MTVQPVPDGASDVGGGVATGLRGRRLAQLAIGGLAALVIGLLLREPILAMVRTWTDSSSYGHCFLILPASAYLAWRQRGRGYGLSFNPDFRGLLAIAAFSLVWLTGYVSEAVVVQEFAVVALIQAALLTILGWPAVRTFAFPLLYLYFAVPLGESMIPELRSATAWFAVGLLKVSGIPVFADGYIISVPNGNWLVADECSGIRFLIASLAVGVLFAGIAYRSWWRRAAFLGLCIVVPIVANGIRAFGIVTIGYYSSNELATGIDHIIYGWIFFTLVSFLLFAIGNRFRDQVDEPAANNIAALAAPRRIALSRPLAAATLAVVLVMAVKVYGANLLDIDETAAVHLQAPASEAPYRSVAANYPLAPQFANADALLRAAYEHDGHIIHLDIGYYRTNRRGAQAVSQEHNLEPLPGLNLSTTTTIEARLDNHPISVRTERWLAGRNGHLIWYWYWVDGRFTGNPYFAKLLETKTKLLGGEPAAAIITLSTDFDETSGSAELELRGFLAQFDGLEPALRGAQR